MSPIDTAWVAGLLEGEGSFVISWVQRKRWRYPTLMAQMNQTDEDVVRKLHRLAGGIVNGPYENSGEGWKPVWRWQLGRREELLTLLTAIRPHMGARRTARIDELIAAHEQYARPKWRHGTRQGYERGCRLECCRLPHNARMRDLRARRAA